MVTWQALLQLQGTAWIIIMVCSLPLVTETMTGTPVATVLHYVKVPGGTMPVVTLTSTASTFVELTTAMVSGGTDSTQLKVATHSSGLR